MKTATFVGDTTEVKKLNRRNFKLCGNGFCFPDGGMDDSLEILTPKNLNGVSTFKSREKASKKEVKGWSK